MAAQRRSTRPWWLGAGFPRLLLMATAATADPALRATRRARAACNWAAKLFVIKDHVDAARYSAGRRVAIFRDTSRYVALSGAGW